MASDGGKGATGADKNGESGKEKDLRKGKHI